MKKERSNKKFKSLSINKINRKQDWVTEKRDINGKKRIARVNLDSN
jgi:hypothetical protein